MQSQDVAVASNAHQPPQAARTREPRQEESPWPRLLPKNLQFRSHRLSPTPASSAPSLSQGILQVEHQSERIRARDEHLREPARNARRHLRAGGERVLAKPGVVGGRPQEPDRTISKPARLGAQDLPCPKRKARSVPPQGFVLPRTRERIGRIVIDADGLVD